jgi:hypothetical protein
VSLRAINGGGAGELVGLLEKMLDRAKAGEIKAMAAVCLDVDFDPEIWRGWCADDHEPIPPLVYGLQMLNYRLMQKTEEVAERVIV